MIDQQSVAACCGTQACGEMTTTPANLVFEKHGKGPEKVLVLHSWMGDSKSFDALKPYLDAATFTYIFANLRGYGGSKSIKGEYSVTEASADVLHLANHLGWKQFHVVGHSMSGMVIQRLIIDDAKQSSPRIKSAVGVTPVTADGFPADEQTRKFLWDLIHQEEMTSQGVSAMTGQRLSPQWSHFVAQYNLATSDANAMRGYYKMWIDTDLSEEAASVKPKTPIRIIGGRQDLPGFSEQKYRETFDAWYPNADLQFITDAGHFPMYETPVYLATLIESHLNANRVSK